MPSSSTFPHIALDHATSTNDEAMARLRAGEPAPFVVTAASQSGGRGRQGRAWQSPPGNLHMSLALRDPAPPNLAPQLGFVAGVALAEALRARLGGDERLQLKWPNDVLHRGAKLAGMLLESTSLPDGAFGCVIGIGINCRCHPEGLPYPATSLSEAGDGAATPDQVLADFLPRFDIQCGIWNGGRGFAAIRATWLSLAAGVGGRIGVATPRGRLDGIFRDLDATGRLLLDTADGTRTVEAGDIFFPALAGATHE